MLKYEIQDENTIVVTGLDDFCLEDTLFCGQCFRFEKNDDGSFFGVAFGKEITVSQQGGTLVLKTTEQDFLQVWKDYFDLELDYAKVKADLSKLHPVLGEAAEYAPGIRILRQEPFEALVSFIISQNNNIKRISKIVKSLCELCGRELRDGVYAFPDANTLAGMSAEDLAPIRAGFRARYIIDAAKKVCSGEVDLQMLNTLSYNEAKSELMKITGVGVKVADCTLLYGFHRLEGFPMDVWMKRAMDKLFNGISGESFGEFAGIAQQYIFHYARMNPKLFE